MKSRSILVNDVPQEDPNEQKWKVALERTMVTFENVLSQVQNQQIWKDKISNLIRSIFSNRSKGKLQKLQSRKFKIK
jgi:hypothetical protein